jgi:hypothetical protein
MEFQVPCECGKDLTVSEAAADSRRPCVCGREVLIPSLKEMRLRAGLPAYNISAEKLIEHMLASGEVPGNGRCANCGKPTTQVVHIETECERSWTVPQGASWGSLVAAGCLWSVILSPVRIIFYGSPPEEERYGSDKSFMLPLCMCPGCVPAMSDGAAIKRCLFGVPAYRQLLDKFPDATVRLVQGWQPQAGLFPPNR